MPGMGHEVAQLDLNDPAQQASDDPDHSVIAAQRHATNTWRHRPRGKRARQPRRPRKAERVRRRRYGGPSDTPAAPDPSDVAPVVDPEELRQQAAALVVQAEELEAAQAEAERVAQGERLGLQRQHDYLAAVSKACENLAVAIAGWEQAGRDVEAAEVEPDEAQELVAAAERDRDAAWAELERTLAGAGRADLGAFRAADVARAAAEHAPALVARASKPRRPRSAERPRPEPFAPPSSWKPGRPSAVWAPRPSKASAVLTPCRGHRPPTSCWPRESPMPNAARQSTAPPRWIGSSRRRSAIKLPLAASRRELAARRPPTGCAADEHREPGGTGMKPRRTPTTPRTSPTGRTRGSGCCAGTRTPSLRRTLTQVLRSWSPRARCAS